MREYIYRRFLTFSIFLSNSYSFYFLFDSAVPSTYKHLHVFNFKINVSVLFISCIYAEILEKISRLILDKEDRNYLYYSLGKFFIHTFINGVIIFLAIYIEAFSGPDSIIQLNLPPGLPSLGVLLFPFLLYAGFLMNYAMSSLVFATKEDYVKNNPNISPNTILLTRLVSIFLYFISFTPFLFVSIYFLNSIIQTN